MLGLGLLKYLPLLSTNVKSHTLTSQKLLLCGSCLREEEPDVLDAVGDDKVCLHVCLEEAHMNVVGFKLATILKVNSPISLTVLTLDGSPHCLQLHMAVDQALKLVKANVPAEHYVVEKGRVVRVSWQTIRIARHLSKIEALLSKADLKEGCTL
ncbi:MAG: hypothetical protein QXK12_03155 [Candidatus Nezhaarchaeales archaeon]